VSEGVACWVGGEVGKEII